MARAALHVLEPHVASSCHTVHGDVECECCLLRTVWDPAQHAHVVTIGGAAAQGRAERSARGITLPREVGRSIGNGEPQFRTPFVPEPLSGPAQTPPLPPHVSLLPVTPSTPCLTSLTTDLLQ